MQGYCTFLQLGRYGRFANQVFQIAGTIGIARKNVMEPVFPVWRNYDHADRFGSREDINVFEHMVNQLPSIGELTTRFLNADVPPPSSQWKPHPVEWGYHDVTLNPGMWDLQGHFQSEKYFAHCIDEVKYYLKMKQEPDSVQPYTVIHARRGDYDNKYHPVIPVHWYVKALKFFPATTQFLVFSDSKTFISELTDTLEINGMGQYASRLFPIYKDYLSSFALMKSCEHFVIGNSSYSAAAAILSESRDKQIIAPAKWFGPAYTNITAKDIYGNNWKII
jgi:hypothetical protein